MSWLDGLTVIHSTFMCRGPWLEAQVRQQVNEEQVCCVRPVAAAGPCIEGRLTCGTGGEPQSRSVESAAGQKV